MATGTGQRVVRGKWFVPAILLGFVAFTVAMSYVTILL